MLGCIQIPVVCAEPDPSLLYRIVLVLLYPSGYGEIAHRLLHALGERTRPLEIGAGEGGVDAAVAEREDIPVTPIPALYWLNSTTNGRSGGDT